MSSPRFPPTGSFSVHLTLFSLLAIYSLKLWHLYIVGCGQPKVQNAEVGVVLEDSDKKITQLLQLIIIIKYYYINLFTDKYIQNYSKSPILTFH